MMKERRQNEIFIIHYRQYSEINITQWPEEDLNKIFMPINQTFTG